MVFDLLTLTSNARGHLLEKQHVRCGSLCWFWFDSFRHVPTCSILWFLFRNLQAGGQWISFHPLPNEDGGLRLWYLRGTPWRRTCKFELFELLTSCYNTVFPRKFRLQSDRFPTNFRHMSVWFPSNFRSFPWVSGGTFHQFPFSFELHFDELRQLGLRLLPDDRLFRTNFQFNVVLIEAYVITFLFLELHQTNM